MESNSHEIDWKFEIEFETIHFLFVLCFPFLLLLVASLPFRWCYRSNIQHTLCHFRNHLLVLAVVLSENKQIYVKIHWLLKINKLHWNHFTVFFLLSIESCVGAKLVSLSREYGDRWRSILTGEQLAEAQWWVSLWVFIIRLLSQSFPIFRKECTVFWSERCQRRRCRLVWERSRQFKS